ncbi:MAG: hypothetical protein ACHQAY_21900 [Hyphomicrobiales bacterium]
MGARVLRLLAAFIAMGVLCALGATAMVAPAFAADPRQAVITGDDWSHPMKFTLVHNNQVFADEVYAVGEIVDDTFANFKAFLDSNNVGPGTKIILHSPGGLAQSGIDMGRLIRERSFDTIVGQTHRPATRQTVDQLVFKIDPAECDSACSLAFLGGVHRRVPTGSVYGVHNLCRVAKAQEHGPAADLFAEGQHDAAVVSAYVEQMGIDADFLSAFVSKNSCKNEIFYVPENLMAEMHITTSRSDTKWEIKIVASEFYLSASKATSSYFPGEHDELNFACHGQPRRLLLQAFFLAPTVDRAGKQKLTPATFASSVKGYRLANTKASVKQQGEEAYNVVVIDPSEVYSRLTPSGAFHVTVFLTLTPRLLAFVQKATDLSFRFHIDDKTYYGFTVEVGSAQDRIKEFVMACK